MKILLVVNIMPDGVGTHWDRAGAAAIAIVDP